MKKLVISSLTSGGIIVNYNCSSACRHCLYACSPTREKSYMSQETAALICSYLKKFNCSSVHIGGGEPLLNLHLLCEVVDVLTKNNIFIEYVETNCSWATTDKKTTETIEQLLYHGIQCLLISVDPFHNEFIPFEKVQRTISSCKKSGMRTLIWQAEFESDILRFDAKTTHKPAEYISHYGFSYFADVCTRYGIVFGGRAADIFRKYSEKYPIGTILKNSSPCQRLANTSHFHIDLYKKYIPTLCTGFSVPIEEIDCIPHKYPLLNGLYAEGISFLYNLATMQYNYCPRGEGYVNNCDLCLDIRKHLFNLSALYLELSPSGFYKAL